MNAPYDQAVVAGNCLHETADPREASSLRPESIRVSSRPLGWKPLNIERREVEPGSDCLPGGLTEHLIFVSLADGHVIRESGGEVAEKDLEAGLVSIHPSDTPVRWEWDTRLSFTMMSLEPDYLNKVARETFDMDPDQVKLRTVEGRRDPVITSIAGTLIREVMNGDAGSRLYAESLANLLSVHILRN
jgi:AraC family transcriptional regulator